jgi:hypothetical protein
MTDGTLGGGHEGAGFGPFGTIAHAGLAAPG